MVAALARRFGDLDIAEGRRPKRLRGGKLARLFGQPQMLSELG